MVFIALKKMTQEDSLCLSPRTWLCTDENTREEKWERMGAKKFKDDVTELLDKPNPEPPSSASCLVRC